MSMSKRPNKAEAADTAAVVEEQIRPELPERFTSGGATAAEREAWIAENWPPPVVDDEGADE